MHKNIRKVLLVCSCSPLLIAAMCEKIDDDPVLISPQTKIIISEGTVFSNTDTLWITSEVSNMLFNEDIQDSIPNTSESFSEEISVLRLRTATRSSNTVDAVNDFEFVNRIGSIDFWGACPESTVIASGPRTPNRASYRYEIGLVPKNTGDYVLSWILSSGLTNSNLNTDILTKYPIEGDTNQLGLTKCGITSTRLDVRETKKEFFFTVE